MSVYEIGGPAVTGVSQTITQSSHGFAVGDWLYLNGSTYAKAQADSEAHAEVVGVVSAVQNVNSFTLTMSGRVTGLSGLTPGAAYFLSPSSAGAITTSETSTVGQVVKPVLIADTSTSGYVVIMRGNRIVDTAINEAVQYATRSSNTKLVSADNKLYLDLTAAITQTFDPAATLGAGWSVQIANEAASPAQITLDPDGAETIDGAATLVLQPGEVRRVISTGSALVTVPVQESYPWITVLKTGDESLNTNTVVQNDDHLSFATVSGAVYEIELGLIYASPAGAGTPDLKIDLGEDATARGVFTSVGLSTADAAQVTNILANQTATITLGTAAANREAKLWGQYVGNGGTFRLRWAQNTSNGNDVTVRGGSYLRYRRVL